MELDPIERRSLGRRHSASVYWTNLRVLALLHKLLLHGNARRSCKQFVFLVRIGCLFEHAALWHLLFCGSECACREVSSMQSHIVVGEIGSLHNRSRCHKFANWLCYLNFGPVHCEMKICWFRTYFSFEVDFPAWIFHRVRKFSQMQLRNRKSRIINHTTVWTRSTSMIKDSTSTLEAWYKYWRILRFLSHFTFRSLCISNKIFEWLKREEVCPSRARGRSKTFPEVHTIIMYHTVIQNRGMAWFWNWE